MMMELRKANLQDAEKEFEFMKNLPADENGFTNPWFGVKREEFVEKCLCRMMDYSEGRNLPDGFVPETFFFLWNDGEIVGQFRIRHHLTEALRNGAGHIGYGIALPFRKRGFAKAGLALALREADALVKEDEIHLRVNRENAASLKVMLANGGRIHHQDDEKIYVRIKKAK